MKSFNIRTIPPDSFFSAPVYLDEGFVLASPETPFSAAVLHALEEWEFREVLSAGEIRENPAGARGREEEPAAPPEDGDGEHLRRAAEFFRNLQGYAERLFMRAAIGMELDFAELKEKAQTVCAVVREERRFLLRIQGERHPEGGAEFLAAHTAGTTIIALIIGYHLKLPENRLIELGIAALVHEIGMVKIPRQAYTARRPLSPEERMSILTHPAASYNILKAARFPPVICAAALQHHERENGSGYPQMLSGGSINLYAKIIAVACSYEALTADRPHKNARDGHTGMMDLLKNEGKVYDDTIIRALVYSLSVYPIGLRVLLSTGQKGQVVEVNPKSPRFPLVRIAGGSGTEGKSDIMETSPEGLRILRPLSREEISSIPGFSD